MNQKVPIHQLLYSTIRIEVDSPHGTSVGTAFIAEHKFEKNYFLFLVTNKHVIENATRGRFFFTLANEKGEPLVGERYDVTIEFGSSWRFHPTEDIAFSPFLPILYHIEKVLKEKVYVKPIPLSLIPSETQIENLTALEEIIFIGYPNAIYDKKNLLPIIRKGTTATPISVDYDGKPLFLIDASVFPGSSGSPVFIYNYGSYCDSNANIVIGNRIYFVGVVSQVLIRKEEGNIDFVEIPTTQEARFNTQQMIDLGVVIKPKVIVEVVNNFLEEIKPKLYINKKLGKFDKPQINIKEEDKSTNNSKKD